MREIKFRAYYLNEREKQANDKAYAEWSTNWEGCDLGYVLDNQDYAVVQYTGLKDEKGIEIYEGDILKLDIRRRNPQGEYVDVIGVMEWEENHNGFTHFSPIERFEVIGNIYKNPELLNGTR